MTQVEGIDYTPEGIEHIRTELGVMREDLFRTTNFGQIVILTHAIALLAHLRDITNDTNS